MILLLQEMIGSNDKSRWAFYSVALMRFAVAFLLRDFFSPRKLQSCLIPTLKKSLV